MVETRLNGKNPTDKTVNKVWGRPPRKITPKGGDGMNWVDNRMEINFDATYRCPLQCPKCMRQYYSRRGVPVDGIDTSLEDFEKIINWFDDIRFCGQVSDPSAHPKLIEMLQMCRDKDKKVKIHNAASHRPMKWYKKAFETYPEAVWEFGVDGLPKDSHKYRVNQDGEKLWKIMQWASKEGYRVDWQWIYFEYNWRDVPEGFRMARDNHINFITVTSHRWVHDDPLRPPYEVMKCKDVYELMELIESGYDG